MGNIAQMHKMTDYPAWSQQPHPHNVSFINIPSYPSTYILPSIVQNKPNLSRATTRDLTNHRKSQRVRICPKPHTERTILQERFIKNKANFTTNRDNTTSSSKKDYDEKFRAGGNKNKPNAEGPDLSGDNDPWSIRYHPESRRAGKASRRISARTMGNRTYSVLPFYKKQSQFPQQ